MPVGIRAFANFYPRSPCGERQSRVRVCQAVIQFLSTLSLRRATGRRRSSQKEYQISIHALLAESDNVCKAGQAGIIQFLSTLSLRRATAIAVGFLDDLTISIHALLAESDLAMIGQTGRLWQFLSTLSLRRATASRRSCRSGRQRHFYPRSPCGERPGVRF